MNSLIGKILQESLQKEGSPSVKDFANMMGSSTRTVYNIFNGITSMTFEQVIKASELLNFDIVQEYYSRAGLEMGNSFNEGKQAYDKYSRADMMTVNISITGRSKNFVEHFGKLISKLKDEVQPFGFTIL